ncbi:helix-turn-helix domain-containing protein [Listeria booriae]|uniref:helix-turn-helix domain-containing protein n=1 Tax=Listeria booriae TaxID=1552123 RepID=UPI0021ADB5AB|nr:helix-turn-helix domain-containing protein [Listeria booriae]
MQHHKGCRSNSISTEPFNRINHNAFYEIIIDEFGNSHVCVDEGLRRRTEAKLVSKLLFFEVM